MVELDQLAWSKTKEETLGAIVLDVRTEEEYAEKHLAESQLLDIRQPQSFMEAANELDKTKSYFVYCRSGARSAQACQLLDQIGVAATYNLKGGILAWRGEVIS